MQLNTNFNEILTIFVTVLLWYGSSMAYSVYTKTLLQQETDNRDINTIALTWYQLLVSCVLYLLGLILRVKKS